MALTKADIIEAVQSEIGFTEHRSTELVEDLLELIKSTLASGFGKFCVKEKSERRGRNPAIVVSVVERMWRVHPRVSFTTASGSPARASALARMAAITTMLPRKALETVAAAAELNAHVLEINLGIFTHLLVDGRLPDPIDERTYCVAMREASTLEECVELVRLAIWLGDTLKGLVKVPLLGGMVRAMRGPAMSP